MDFYFSRVVTGSESVACRVVRVLACSVQAWTSNTPSSSPWLSCISGSPIILHARNLSIFFAHATRSHGHGHGSASTQNTCNRDSASFDALCISSPPPPILRLSIRFSALTSDSLSFVILKSLFLRVELHLLRYSLHFHVFLVDINRRFLYLSYTLQFLFSSSCTISVAKYPWILHFFSFPRFSMCRYC